MALDGSKISDLQVLPTTTIEDNDLWEVVRSGVNYRINGATFKSVMGQYGGGTGGGIADVPDVPNGVTYIRRSRVGQSGEWVQTNIPDAYTLLPATASVLGGIKVGSGFAMDAGVLSALIASDTSAAPSTTAGIVKADGTSIVCTNGVISAVGGGTGGGSVVSVGLALPNIFTITNPSVTTSGTLTAVFTTQPANTIFAGPASGSATVPTFRALVVADLPTMTSTEFAGKISNETGTGSLVFADSPVFTGNPTAPTQATSDNSTRIATTAFVKAAATAVSLNFETTTSNIKMNGTVSVGALDTVPRADHIHPTDTSRAAKNGSGTEPFTATSVTCSSIILNGHTLTIS